MKRIQTLCLLGALLCGLCGTAWGSTPRTTGNSPRIEVKGTTDDDENERLERDERHVKSLMRQSRSGEAIEYLQQTLTNKYPTDANVQFGYATLLQELAVAVNNEGMVAAYSFDLAKAAAATSQVNVATPYKHTCSPQPPHRAMRALS